MYWAKVFDSRNAGGERKYKLLLKVRKSCLSLPNSNASVERSISENKNNHRPKRSSLSDERLMELRQIKAHACELTGAENVNTLDKRIMKKMQVAHSNYINRKEKEEAEKLLS